MSSWGFPGGSVVKNLPVNAGHVGTILIWEEATCFGATKPFCHNYWACAPESGTCDSWTQRAVHASAHAPQQEKLLQREAHLLQLEKSPDSSKDPGQPKINQSIKIGEF